MGAGANAGGSEGVGYVIAFNMRLNACQRTLKRGLIFAEQYSGFCFLLLTKLTVVFVIGRDLSQTR